MSNNYIFSIDNDNKSRISDKDSLLECENSDKFKKRVKEIVRYITYLILLLNFNLFKKTGGNNCKSLNSHPRKLEDFLRKSILFFLLIHLII